MVTFYVMGRSWGYKEEGEMGGWTEEGGELHHMDICSLPTTPTTPSPLSKINPFQPLGSTERRPTIICRTCERKTLQTAYDAHGRRIQTYTMHACAKRPPPPCSSLKKSSHLSAGIISREGPSEFLHVSQAPMR